MRLVVLPAALVTLFVAMPACERTGPAREVRAVGPGTHDFAFRFEGRRREYRLHVPPSLGAEPAPVVLAFHGRFGDGEDQAELSHLDEVADQHGFVAVYPDGVGRSWNAGSGAGFAERRDVDDVAFVSALINRLSRQVPVDRRRVYAAGMSNGANFVHRLGCELSDRIAAIAAIAGTIASEAAQDCDPSRPVSALQVHGTGDRFNPWQGGETKGGGEVESVGATAAHWVKRDGCRGSAVAERLTVDATRMSWSSCSAGTEVEVVRVEDGGHTWPGGRQYLPPALVGETTETFEASQLMWSFFSGHQRRAP